MSAVNFTIDLLELAVRESEKVEWKENGADIDTARSIVRTISAFANDLSNLGGGYVVCGAKETKDEYGFPKVLYTGLSSKQIKEIEGRVLQYCRNYVSPAIAPVVQELDSPNDAAAKILVFVVFAGLNAHIYRDGEKSAYYVRIGKEIREARNGILARLLAAKHQIIPFDKRANPKTKAADIDLFVFRDCLENMKILRPEKSPEEYLSDKEQIAEFVPPLLEKNALDGTFCLRNFALFLFGKKQAISVNFPDIYIIVSIYNGTDRSGPTAEQHIFNGSIIEQAQRAAALLNTQVYTVFDKTNAKPNQIKYPQRALQEALINAIVHRDYEFYEPIRVTVFSDRIEIRSPGSLHWGVSKEQFYAGRAGPKWRNQSFAYLFNKLQLTQAEGQGIPTIIRTMKEEGCPAPVFETAEDSVTCILPAHLRHVKVDSDDDDNTSK